MMPSRGLPDVALILTIRIGLGLPTIFSRERVLMSYEAWGDGDYGLDGYVTDARAEEIFILGLQAMREMLARFVEQGGDHNTAMSIRANWNPEWGPDPGRPDSIVSDCWI